jgi:gliding motility-associated lipoprotein GldH
MSPKKLLTYLFTIGSVLLLYSCTNPNTVICETQAMENNAWLNTQKVTIPFEITDTKASYTIYYTFRYNDQYPYYNIWVNRIFLDEKEKAYSKKLQGMELFHSQSGVPHGSGFGDAYDYKILSDSLYHFPSPGKYSIQIEPSMRTDSLQGIESVGIEIYKNENQ